MSNKTKISNNQLPELDYLDSMDLDYNIRDSETLKQYYTLELCKAMEIDLPKDITNFHLKVITQLIEDFIKNEAEKLTNIYKIYTK